MCIMAHAHRYSKRTESTSSKASNGEQAPKEEDNPNIVVYRKVSTLSLHYFVEINKSSEKSCVRPLNSAEEGLCLIFPRPPFAARHSVYLTNSTLHEERIVHVCCF